MQIQIDPRGIVNFYAFIGINARPATLHMVGTRLAGEGGLMDADGAAFIIHARADDMKSDPSGNSGERIACGVIQPAAAK